MKFKRQISLRRLLGAVTIVASVLALATAYPIATAELVTVNLLLIAPSAIVFGIAYWLSKNRRRTTILLFTGIFLGNLFAPSLFVSWDLPPTFWDRFRINFDTIGLFMFGGAIIATVVDLLPFWPNNEKQVLNERLAKYKSDPTNVITEEQLRSELSNRRT